MAAGPRIPARTVVLTLDDAVKSHRTFVGPFLLALGFRATFFVTQRWMDDPANFMTWDDIGELHRMGFEIGNHSWTHAGFNSPRTAAQLGDELGQVERELWRVGVPRPRSFAWCGNAFGPEAVQVLRERGYRLARRGMQPEVAYGTVAAGPAFVPGRHHPLLIPTTGDAYPGWTEAHFRDVLAAALPGQAVVLQFHGVPDIAHPWVHTEPENFRRFMGVLKAGGFTVLALEDLLPYLDPKGEPMDPTLNVRYP